MMGLFLNEVIDITKFVKRFQKFFDDISTCINVMSDREHLFCKAFRNLNFMTTLARLFKTNDVVS